MTDERVSIDFDSLLEETEKAYKLRIDQKIVWLPISETTIYVKTKKAFIPEWLAFKKGLI